LGATGLLSAQETFAPLITDNCVGFAHIDLRKVEFDKIKSAVEKMNERDLQEMNFDSKSAKAIKREFDKLMSEMDKIIRPMFKLFADDLGLRELAVIVNVGKSINDEPIIFLAIPWKNKTQKDLETLAELFEPFSREIMGGIIKGDFLILTGSINVKAIDWIQNIVPSKSTRIFDALKDSGDGEVKVAFAVNDHISEMIKSASDVSLPIPVKSLILFATNKIEWISVSVSFGEIIGESNNLGGRLVIKFPSNADAVFFRSLIEVCIDYGIFFAKTAVEEQAKNEPHGLFAQTFIPFIAEYSGGLLRKLLPEVKEDRLVISFDLDNNQASYVAAVIGVGFVRLLSTAVESQNINAGLSPSNRTVIYNASRLQDANKVRRIILALHNYHDAHGKCPPLYTVDANGKPLHSWRVLILPYIEMNALHDMIKLDEPWDSEHNKQFHKTVIGCYTSQFSKDLPLDKNCNFAVIEEQPLKPKDGISLEKITDGTSNTLSVVITRKPFCWMDPLANVKLSDLDKGLNKADSVVGYENKPVTPLGFWDGSVKQIANSIDPTILKALGTANGGERYAPPSQ
jgi:hypothetical protein